MKNFACPFPKPSRTNIIMAHGGGGKLTHNLINSLFSTAFDNPILAAANDGATLPISNSKKLAFSTDSFVVHPLFFPGGDIGKLAVFGTSNDIAMCGAKPEFLSLALIIEEGFPMETLEKITMSIKAAAKIAGVRIVTGDTKVVEHGKCDGIYINTSGIGTISHELKIEPTSVRPGDGIILSGDIGRHGTAIMASREGISFETPIESDCAYIGNAALDLIEKGINVKCMRDITRGGLATALVEIAEKSETCISFDENAIPVEPSVQGACELLGFDPIYVANEGRFIAFIPENQAPAAIEILSKHEISAGSKIIGKVVNSPDNTKSQVTIKSKIGVERIVDMLSGEQLPRIC